MSEADKKSIFNINKQLRTLSKRPQRSNHHYKRSSNSNESENDDQIIDENNNSDEKSQTENKKHIKLNSGHKFDQVLGKDLQLHLYEQKLLKYEQDEYTQNIENFLRNLAFKINFSEVSKKFPLLKILKCITKKFFLNEHEISYFGYQLEKCKFDIQSLEKHAELLQITDFLNMIELNEPKQYKAFLLFILINAYLVKQFMNSQQELEIIDSNLRFIFKGEKKKEYFLEIFQVWKNDVQNNFLDVANGGKINHIEINDCFKKFSQRTLDLAQESDNHDYNSLVDSIIQISPPYNYEKNQNQSKTEVPVPEKNEIQFNEQKRDSIQNDDSFYAYPLNKRQQSFSLNQKSNSLNFLDLQNNLSRNPSTNETYVIQNLQRYDSHLLMRSIEFVQQMQQTQLYQYQQQQQLNDQQQQQQQQQYQQQYQQIHIPSSLELKDNQKKNTILVQSKQATEKFNYSQTSIDQNQVDYKIEESSQSQDQSNSEPYLQLQKYKSVSVFLKKDDSDKY